MEGRYDEPMARNSAARVQSVNPMAGHSAVRARQPDHGGAFAREGSIEDSMAAAFASEGVSAFKDIQIADFIHTEISDSEIGDAPDYDYNARPGSDILSDGFDLKKAVIYSAVLNRKEYSV